VKCLVAAVLAMALLSTGCFRRVREETQLAERSWLKFPDAPRGTNVTATGPASYTFSLGSSQTTRFAVRPGTYRVTASVNGKLLFDRKIFVADGETRELLIR